MRIPESVCSELVPVSRDASVLEAVKVIASQNIGSVVVIEEGALVGIFTERDLLKRVVLEGHDPSSTKVGDVMTSSVVSVDVDTPLIDLLSLMDEHHIRHVPVLKDGKPHAMTTMRSLQRLSLGHLREENRTLQALLVTDGAGG